MKISKLSSLIFIFFFMLLSCQGKGMAKTGLQKTNAFAKKGCEINTTAEDSVIFKRMIHYASGSGLSISETVNRVAGFFLETPYVASTLEAGDHEQLVINLREMDCTTFVEYVAASVICLKTGNTRFSDFAEKLTKLRYRNGKIDGYSSRLHYFTEWLHNKGEKGFVNIISNQIGSKKLNVNVNFMSANPHHYKQLKSDSIIGKIKLVEREISSLNMNYISVSEIESNEKMIENGDIIAFVTNIKGLDVSHVGFAVKVKGRLHLLHASLKEGKIAVTKVPLSQYLLTNKKVDGIMVARIISNNL